MSVDRLLLSRSDLKRLGIGLSRWTIKRLEDDNAFPKSVVVGRRRLAWPRDAVMSWIAEKSNEHTRLEMAGPVGTHEEGEG